MLFIPKMLPAHYVEKLGLTSLIFRSKMGAKNSQKTLWKSLFTPSIFVDLPDSLITLKQHSGEVKYVTGNTDKSTAVQ
jgi:hypothetical protein